MSWKLEWDDWEDSGALFRGDSCLCRELYYLRVGVFLGLFIVGPLEYVVLYVIFRVLPRW